ncbi:hypothetical protein J4Q44_G00217230 [Coregonus suidteri]|uniref:Uncharacterized protein n=1 Tax=Coregonus suidteri TaxID=861788 RepID=A0AAN8R0V1_9TELE
MRLAGPLRAVAVLLLVGFIWVLASSILGGDSNSVVKHLFSEPKPRRYKCGLSAPCPQKHLAFRVVSGAANVIGPKICLEDKILVSRVNNNGYVESSWTQSFDTWAGDVTDLLKYLLPLQEGTLVFVASFDDPAQS